MPVDARDQVHVGERLGAVLGFVPGLEGEAWDAEVGAGLQLRAAQGRHAGEGRPWSFLALGRAVDDQDVADALAHQAESGDDARLAGADDQDVEGGLSGVQARHHPLGVRMGGQLQVARDPCFEG